jgi:hypothetical protein
VWEKCWDKLLQAQIQAWIEKIPVHIQKIIELEGRIEYNEGRGIDRSRSYQGLRYFEVSCASVGK